MTLPLFPDLFPAKPAPFIQWAGGKRQLLPELLRRMPDSYNRYYEPFLGGGALFWELCPDKAFISDANSKLIAAYKAIKYYPDELMQKLDEYDGLRGYDDFFRIRNLDRSPEFKDWEVVDRGAWFIYVLKTCFNGLYRENADGFCNSPYGTPLSFPTNELILLCHKQLNKPGVDVFCHDFGAVELTVKKGDFVYLDPPYFPNSRTANHVGYVAGGFDDHQQQRVKDLCLYLDRIGAKFMLSNSHCEKSLEMYKEFNVDTVSIKRRVAADGKKREAVQEIIVRNY